MMLHGMIHFIVVVVAHLPRRVMHLQVGDTAEHGRSMLISEDNFSSHLLALADELGRETPTTSTTIISITCNKCMFFGREDLIHQLGDDGFLPLMIKKSNSRALLRTIELVQGGVAKLTLRTCTA